MLLRKRWVEMKSIKKKKKQSYCESMCWQEQAQIFSRIYTTQKISTCNKTL